MTGAIGLFATQTRAADDKAANAPKPALTVTLVQPQSANVGIKLSANGNIAAWAEASVSSEAAGLRLTEVRANVGDRVRAGQVLAVFAAEGVQADVAQARAGLGEAQANAAEALANAERARSLKSSGALSEQQLSQYFTAEQTANARVESAKAMLASQQLRLKHTQVLAPDSGIISTKTATVGAVLGAGTELFRMIRQGRLEWRAEVTAAEVDRIKVGTLATLTTASGTQVKGKVRVIAPTVDTQSRAALVYVDLPNQEAQFPAGPPQGKLAPSGGSVVREATSVGALRAGTYSRGEFELGNSNAVTVPQAAVIVRDGFSYVYQVGADNKAARIKVQTGRTVGDRVEIVSALDAKARLVATGAGFLNEGDLVRVVDAMPAAATANSPSKGANSSVAAPANAASVATK